MTIRQEIGCYNRVFYEFLSTYKWSYIYIYECKHINKLKFIKYNNIYTYNYKHKYTILKSGKVKGENNEFFAFKIYIIDLYDDLFTTCTVYNVQDIVDLLCLSGLILVILLWFYRLNIRLVQFSVSNITYDNNCNAVFWIYFTEWLKFIFVRNPKTDLII